MSQRLMILDSSNFITLQVFGLFLNIIITCEVCTELLDSTLEVEDSTTDELSFTSEDNIDSLVSTLLDSDVLVTDETVLEDLETLTDDSSDDCIISEDISGMPEMTIFMPSGMDDISPSSIMTDSICLTDEDWEVSITDDFFDEDDCITTSVDSEESAKVLARSVGRFSASWIDSISDVLEVMTLEDEVVTDDEDITEDLVSEDMDSTMLSPPATMSAKLAGMPDFTSEFVTNFSDSSLT